MATTSPSTPENTPRRVAMNRSFTVPTKLSTSSRNAPTAEIGAADGIETLYVHPSATIIKFSTSSPGSRPSSSSGSPRSPAQSSSGTLPWASPTERTLAAGPLEIYRVPGSVSFLHSGALLHAILPRSQCWCVDGVSKFALRVLQDTYYRIELPGATPEDLEKVEEMKVTLKKVLFYERTACPFARGFNVDLPEESRVRKGRRKSHGPAKRWTLDRAYSWKPEDGVEVGRRGSESEEGSGSTGSEEDEEPDVTPEEERESQSEKTMEGAIEQENQDAIEPEKAPIEAIPPRPKALADMRSITAPPQLTLRSSPPSRIRSTVHVDGTVEVSDHARPSTPQMEPSRLRTFQAIPTDMPPSPPDSSAGLESAETLFRAEAVPHGGADAEQQPTVHETELTEQLHNQEPTIDRRLDGTNDIPDELTYTGTHAAPHPFSDDAPRIDTPTPGDSSLPASRTPTPPPHPVSDDPFAAIQARILARRSIGGTTSFHVPSRTSPTRKSSSSTSSTATLASRVSTNSNTTRQQALATALVKRACAVFLGPPAHLVALMLRIAARFANGAFGLGMDVGRGFVVETPAGSKHVPGSYNLESLDHDELGLNGLDGDGEEEGEDDFGVPLFSPVRLANRDGNGMEGRVRERRGWDVD